VFLTDLRNIELLSFTAFLVYLFHKFTEKRFFLIKKGCCNMRLSSLVCLSLLVPAASFAMTTTPGAYVQGSLGETAIFELPILSGGTPTTFSGRLAAGYLWGYDNFNYGIEVGGMYYPSASDSVENVLDYKVDGYNIDMLGVLKYTADSGVILFAKAGAAYVNQKLELSIPYFGLESKTDSKIAPEVALGAGYQFSDNWEMNLTVTGVFAGASGNNNVVTTNGSAMIGVSYRFT
jgi:opacity protein-like surface antigen